jgi:type I restriction enzyme M protein
MVEMGGAEEGQWHIRHDNALTGDDLIDYVNRQLFPYLQGFKQPATSPDIIEYKIGESSAK